MLLPTDGDFEKFEPAYNLRTMLRPQVRALCKTPNAVAAMVDWARTNNVPFATRCGGHSYEGFSQSTGAVIDTRLMKAIEISGDNVTVGAGAALGDIYKKIGAKGLAIPAGSCPTVGVSGHVLGGGFGLLGRPFGLACDSLEWIELVDPQGKIVEADQQQRPDLFWACRGGGGGSFGLATRYRFKLRPVSQVVTFAVDWSLDPAGAAKVMKAWQAWAPQAPKTITSIFRLGKRQNGSINAHCAGQSVGSIAEVRRELGHLLNVKQPDAAPNIKARTFLQAVDYFSGGWDYESTYSKCKSDYVLSPLSDDGIATLIAGLGKLPANAIVPICDAYGGAVADVAPDATAFPHRAGTLYCIQYYSSWASSTDTAQRVEYVRDLYASMRPYVSGAAYVNYCDLDLPDWANAYWGANLPRLRQVKSAFDPDNVFRHAQSVPLAG
ncbi:MAG TPA: FAD-binding oxidoreductase [Xanthobacteraceae bacterium]|nr:FAD-binding oxidoreductase [Xanthobacteraceae bacterium]